MSSAPNILEVGRHGDFAIYHYVLNRPQWSPPQLSRVLLLLVARSLGSRWLEVLKKSNGGCEIRATNSVLLIGRLVAASTSRNFIV